MWAMSNSPHALRTALCSATIEEYCTGMSQPAKSTIRPPWATCQSWQGVFNMVQGSRFKVQGLGFQVSSFRFQVTESAVHFHCASEIRNPKSEIPQHSAAPRG